MEEFNPQTFSLILAGDCDPIKKSFVDRLRICVHDRSMEDSSRLLVRSNRGLVTFNLNQRDTTGDEEDGYEYEGGSCAFIMFDVSDRATFKNVNNVIKDITRGCGNTIPIVLLGAHALVSNPKVKQTKISALLQKCAAKGRGKVTYFPLQNNNDEDALLYLTRQVLGDKSLFFYQASDWHNELVQAAGMLQYELSDRESFVIGILGSKPASKQRKQQRDDDDDVEEEAGRCGSETKMKQDQVISLLLKTSKSREEAGMDPMVMPVSLLVDVVDLLLPSTFFWSSSSTSKDYEIQDQEEDRSWERRLV